MKRRTGMYAYNDIRSEFILRGGNWFGRIESVRNAK